MRGGMITAALVGLLLLAAAETAQAQISFSYGRGPGYGGFSVGSPYFSYGRGYGYGGYYGYPYRYGYYSPYRYGGVGIRIGSPYYGYTPGYYGYSSGYYVTDAPAYSPVPSYAVESPAREYRSFYSPSSDQATVRVSLPVSDAKVWFEDSLTEQKGRSRTFVSPRLEAGQTYAYNIKATWTEDGREVTQEKEVRVRPGQEATVTFESAARARERLPEPRVDDTEPSRREPRELQPERREKTTPPPPEPRRDPAPPPPE